MATGIIWDMIKSPFVLDSLYDYMIVGLIAFVAILSRWAALGMLTLGLLSWIVLLVGAATGMTGPYYIADFLSTLFVLPGIIGSAVAVVRHFVRRKWRS